ncbi:MMPL family transporter [Sulfidibacter corallicola]|uniref:MMPL family transporter n=1 Tax=Sulfidibacter corallicola TaxID=2818388 RepID=A0A8A4TTW5_SULCO|nr:MMPL family transporter [Sulfidibacter corallicola]QTD49975.1 MMPL family transporter [Sulfidibacter corallicola]
MQSPKENRFVRAASRFLVDRPFTSMALGVLLIALMVTGLPRLQSDFSYRMWFRESDPLLKTFDEFERQFGNDETVALALHSESGIFDVESAELLQRLTDDLWQIPEMIRVDSLANYNWVHAEGDDMFVDPFFPDDEPLTAELLKRRRQIALDHEILPGYLISQDGRTALIFGTLKPAIGGTPDFEVVVNGIRKMLRTYAHNPELTDDFLDDLYLPHYRGPGDYQIYVSGSAAVNQSFKDVTQRDLRIMVPILLATIVLFLFFSFRRVSGVLLPFVVIGPSIFMALGFAGWTGFKFNNLTATIPQILISIAIADSVHILVTYFQYRKSGLGPVDGVEKTLLKNFTPTLLTSFSTMLGFFSFATAELVPIVGLGVLAGVGTLFAWLVTILILCPLLSLLPIKVRGDSERHKPNAPHPLAVRYARWLRNNGKLVIAGYGLITLVALIAAFQNDINANAYHYFAPETHLRIANQFMEDRVGGTSAIELSIDSGQADGIKDPSFLKRVGELQEWAESRPQLTKTIAITDIIKQSNRSLHGEDPAAYLIPEDRELVAQELFLYTLSLPPGMDLNNRMSLDNRRLRLTIMTSIHETARSLEEFEVIMAKAKELGLDATLTGKMPLYSQMNGHVVRAFIRSIGLAVVLIAILMVFVLRSWKIGLLSMIPNTIPLILGGMLMTLSSKPLDIGTVLVFSTCMGIAVDDTVHFLTNYLRWRKAGLESDVAVAQVLTHTGPALLVTTLILAAGFGTFAFASFVPNINFGIMSATVLTTALVTDGTLLPALMVGMGEAASTAAAPGGEAIDATA